LRDPKSGGNQTEYLSHGGSFLQAREAGELEIVKTMVYRTQVDMEARDRSGSTPLHWAARTRHLPVVQYLCERGADKQARDGGIGHHCIRQQIRATSLWCSTCASKGLTRRRGIMVTRHNCTVQHKRVTSLWCSTCASRGLAWRRGVSMKGHHCTWQ